MVRPNNDLPATKKDVEEITRKIVTEVVAGATNEILGAMEKEINRLETKVDKNGATTNRIENKLDATIKEVDDHEVRIKQLEKAPA